MWECESNSFLKDDFQNCYMTNGNHSTQMEALYVFQAVVMFKEYIDLPSDFSILPFILSYNGF